MRRLVLIISVILLFPVSKACSQYIEQYKDKIPAKSYEYLLEKEIRAFKENDLIKRANILEGVAKTAIELDEDLAIKLFEKAMNAAQESSNDSMIARIWMIGSVPFINKGLYDIADERLGKAFDYWKDSKDSLNLAECYILQGYVERVRGQHYLALDNLYKAKALQSDYLKPYEMWDVTNHIMLNYSGMADYQSAVEIAEEYIRNVKEGERTSGYYLIIMNASSYHFELENYDKAKEYIDIVLPSLRKSGYPKYLASIYSQLSGMTLTEGDVVLANSYADSSIMYAEKFNTPASKMNAYLRKYQALKEIGNEVSQFHFLNKGYETALATNRKSSILWAAESFSEYEFSQSNFKSAYNYLFIADSLREEVFSEDLASKMDELEKKLLLEKSQEEIQLLNEQNELKEQNLKKASRFRKILIGFLSLALGTCGLIYLLLRQRSQYNDKLEAKNSIITKALTEKEILLKEIHHRVKNNLHFISALLGLQTDHVSDQTALDALQEGQDRVQSMALIHQDLYQRDDLTSVNMKEYFVKLIEGLFDSYNIRTESISLKLNIAELNLDVDSVIPIGLIVNELISNCLKYAFVGGEKGEIEVTLKEADNQLLLTVADDGVGMKKTAAESLGDSLGYKLVTALTEQLEGAMDIDNTDGTQVSLTFKKYQKSVLDL